MISFFTAGALGVAMMLNLSAERPARLSSPSTEFTQALIETTPTAVQVAAATATAPLEGVDSASIAPLLMTAPIPRLTIFALLAAALLLSALLILISRWRLPISPPIGDDPARYLRRSLL